MAYLSIDELSVLGGPQTVIEEYDESVRLQFIAAAEAQADEYLAKQYTVPLSSGQVTAAMKLHIARMVFYFLVSSSGYDPDSDDKAVLNQYTQALDYFRRIALGTVLIPGGSGSGSGGSEAIPPGGSTPSAAFFSDPPRGW